MSDKRNEKIIFKSNKKYDLNSNIKKIILLLKFYDLKVII